MKASGLRIRWMQEPRIDPRARLPRRIARPTLTKLWETAATSRTGYHRWLWETLLSVLYGTRLYKGADAANSRRASVALSQPGFAVRQVTEDLLHPCGVRGRRDNGSLGLGRDSQCSI